MKLKLALLALGLMAGSAVVQAHEQSPHWEYKGKAGATNWGDLQNDFASCKLGKEQSPIDIRGAKKAKLDPIDFEYTAGAAEVVNNGHTIQVNLESGGTIELSDGEYKLLQFHFHTPSEERIDGKRYPLVAHLVHKSADGKLAVVAVLFKLGKENAALKQVFASLPAKEGEKKALEGGIDLTSVLPKERGYYAFKGSLTTPPCSEGVRWQVMKTTSEISGKQLAAFKKLYSMNARPTQPLNGRKLEVSE
jgi:carbonic anhydrase